MHSEESASEQQRGVQESAFSLAPFRLNPVTTHLLFSFMPLKKQNLLHVRIYQEHTKSNKIELGYFPTFRTKCIGKMP